MKKAGLFFCLSIFAFSVVVFAAGPNVHDGLWEIIITMEMPGMPAGMPFGGQPIKQTHCYTKKELEDNKNTVPKSNEECKITDYKLSGNKATWSMQCKGKDVASGTGEIIYKGDSYEATMKVQDKSSNHGSMQMVQHIKGRRIGNCK